MYVCADCAFIDLAGHRTAYVWQGSNASFVDCTFANNTIFDDDSYYGAATVVAHAGSRGDINVKMQGVTFADNSPTHANLLADNRGVLLIEGRFYTDDDEPVCVLEGQTRNQASNRFVNNQSFNSFAK